MKYIHSLSMRRVAVFVMTIIFSICITLATPTLAQSKTNPYYNLDEAYLQSYGSKLPDLTRQSVKNLPIPLFSRDFSQSELLSVVQSFLVLGSVLSPNSQVRPCIERYATKDLNSSKPVTISVGLLSRPGTVTPNGSVSAFWDNWHIAVNGRQTQRTNIPRQSVYIDRYYQDGNELGEAEVGINWRYGNDNPYRSFRISLNARNIGNGSDSYVDSAGNTIPNMLQLSSTIFHELLHNMGYTHADVVDGNFKPVVGNFVYEASWCVKRNGRNRPSGDFGLTSSGDSDRLFVDNVSGRPMILQQPTNPPNSGENPTKVIVDPNFQPLSDDDRLCFEGDIRKPCGSSIPAGGDI